MYSDKKESVISYNCLVNTVFMEMLANKLLKCSLSGTFPYNFLSSSFGVLQRILYVGWDRQGGMDSLVEFLMTYPFCQF